MINRVNRNGKRSISAQEILNSSSSSPTRYLLISNKYILDRNIPYDAYKIYWISHTASRNRLADADGYRDITDFPLQHVITTTYQEICNIHKSSRYVLPSDIQHILNEIIGDYSPLKKDF